MMRTMTRSLLVAFPLAMGLALTGCGTGGGDGAGGGGGDAAGLSRDEKAVKFAECMRENGVDMEDPEPGKPGGIQIRGGEGGQESVDKAMEACKEYNVMADSQGKADPEMAKKNQEFAECMRENGVDEFPDPEPGQRGVRVNKETGEDPDFEKAMEECRPVLGGPGGGAAGGE